jgi:sugar porter (SP) family MFS transporter
MFPESPRWFVIRGKDDEALFILSKLDRTTPDDPAILEEFNLMKADLQGSEGAQAGWKALFSFGRTREFQRMVVGASGQFFQQFTGCNAAIYYSTLLFETNLERRLALVLGGIFSTVYALFTIPSFFMVERVGRRNLYLIGFIGQGCSLIITMGCLVHPTEQNSKGAAVGIFLFIAFFAFTILPLPWIYPPEINPLHTRTRAAAISTCTNWISNFAVVMFTPVFSSTSGWGMYLFFALINFIGVPWAWFFYPETAGRELEEVDIIFAKAHNEGKWAYQVAAKMPKLNNEEIARVSAEVGVTSPDKHAHEKTEMGVNNGTSGSGEGGQE